MGKKKEAVAKAITADELTEVQKYVNALQQIQMQLGGTEMQKAELIDNVKALRAKLTEVQAELEKTYGDVSINLQDGPSLLTMQVIRKISIGKDYKNDAMHYSVGQEVYGGHTIVNILEEEDKYSVYIQKGDLVMPWKDFNKNMAVSIEYDLKW